MSKSLRIGTFTPVKLLNNPLTSCSLRNFNFLLADSEHFDKRIIRLFLLLTFGFLFSLFFLYLKH